MYRSALLAVITSEFLCPTLVCLSLLLLQGYMCIERGCNATAGAGPPFGTFNGAMAVPVL
jgi:hypothetical protein